MSDIGIVFRGEPDSKFEFSGPSMVCRFFQGKTSRGLCWNRRNVLREGLEGLIIREAMILKRVATSCMWSDGRGINVHTRPCKLKGSLSKCTNASSPYVAHEYRYRFIVSISPLLTRSTPWLNRCT